MTAPNSFTGLHAGRYDLIYAEKPYADEARFVARELARRGAPAAGRLLDLACGTGRHALEFAAMGYQVTGADFSSELLERARSNAEDAGATIELVHQDMRRLDLDRERFDLITCLFDSIGYPQSNEGVVAALAGACRHLEPAGLLAVEFLHAPAMLSHAAPVRVRRWETPEGGQLLRVSETTLDPVRQVMTVAYELVELMADGSYEHFTEEQSNRFFAIEEMRALMESAGLQALDFVPSFEDGEDIAGDTFHVMAFARRQ